ncbi:unnamed protein product [Prorocentrum cordatum]|uniref:Uncharacterized protein n=1 Tax=Prorocentrum cordatum TaxID=2364126 RepID=A0ABN9TJ49_9DINO|nr:unnamed protein product [Polarella glacialis]
MAAAAPQPTSQVAGMVGWRVDGGPPEVATPERPRATPSPWRLEAELRQRSRRAGLLRAELAEEELACRRLRERLGIAAESPQKGEEEEEGPAGRGSPRALASQLAALATPLRRGCPPSPVLPRSAAAILLSPGAPVRDGGEEAFDIERQYEALQPPSGAPGQAALGPGGRCEEAPPPRLESPASLPPRGSRATDGTPPAEAGSAVRCAPRLASPQRRGAASALLGARLRRWALRSLLLPA